MNWLLCELITSIWKTVNIKKLKCYEYVKNNITFIEKLYNYIHPHGMLYWGDLSLSRNITYLKILMVALMNLLVTNSRFNLSRRRAFSWTNLQFLVLPKFVYEWTRKISLNGRDYLISVNYVALLYVCN